MTSNNPSTLVVPDESRLDVIPKLLTCDLFSESQEVVLQGFEELTTLCYDARRHNALKVMNINLISAMSATSATKTKASSDGLAGNTPKAEVIEYNTMIAAQKELESNNRAAIRDFGGHLAIAVVMKRWLGSAYIQAAACKALYYAAYHADPTTEAFQDLAVHVGTMEVVLSSLQTYATDEKVQLWGIRALVNLAWQARNFTPLILETDGRGINAFVSAMNTFPMDIEIQRAGCFFLMKISNVDVDGNTKVNNTDNNENSYWQDIREIIVKAGGRRVLLAAIENHPEEGVIFEDVNESIQKNARNTMKALCDPIDPSLRRQTGSGGSAGTSGSGIGSIFKKISLF